MQSCPPAKRPHYANTERFAILALREARGWSIVCTAEEFQVTPQTVANWLRLLDDDALVQAPAPLNRFPDFLQAVIQGMKETFPLLGPRAIANWIARGGIHISASTVRRCLKRPPMKPPQSPAPAPSSATRAVGRCVTSKPDDLHAGRVQRVRHISLKPECFQRHRHLPAPVFEFEVEVAA